MPECKIQFFCETDGCTYCWDSEDKKWIKICPVDELPHDVKRKVLTATREALEMPELPV
jgi:hypothetical protein